MKTLRKLLEKCLFIKVKEIGVIKGIGFKPEDNFYIDEHVYVAGIIKLKTNRYWNMEDYKNSGIKRRTIVKGFINKQDRIK